MRRGRKNEILACALGLSLLCPPGAGAILDEAIEREPTDVSRDRTWDPARDLSWETALPPTAALPSVGERIDVAALLNAMQVEIELARQSVDERREALSLSNADGTDDPTQDFETSTSAAFAGRLAAMVAKTVLQGAKQQATGMAFNEVLGSFGFGGDEQRALSQIQQSLERLEEQMLEVLDGIKDILDAQSWSDFLMAQNEVGIRAGEIHAYMRDYVAWHDTGFEPDEQYVREIALLTFSAIGQLNGALLDETAGAVTLLTKAASVNHVVSDLNEYWSSLAYYRDVYTAVYAEALMLLAALEPHDPSGSVAQRLYTSEILAIQTIEDLNRAMGVPIFQSPASQYIHVQGEDWIFSDGGRPTFPRESWERLENRNPIEKHLNAIRDKFHANSHGVSNLEEYLDQMNLRKGFDFLDTFQVYSFLNGFHLFYQARHDIVEVKGNNLSTRRVNDGPAWSEFQYKDAYSRAAQDSLLAKWIRQMGPPQAQVMEVELNSAGRAAWFEEDWIESMVVGVKGLEIDSFPEFHAVQLTIDEPFADYPRLQIRDAETGTVFASVVESQPFMSVEIPPNGQSERLILIQQGQNTNGRFYPRAESAFVIDGTHDVLVRINDSAPNLSIYAEGDGSVTVHDASGELLCEKVGTCSVDYPWGEDVVITAVPGPLSKLSHWDGSCEAVEGEPNQCRFTHNVGDRSVTAHFDDAPVVYVTVEIDDAGTQYGVVHADGSFVCGMWEKSPCEVPFAEGRGEVTLTAHPSTVEAEFTGWSGACSGTGSCKIDPDEVDEAVRAHFEVW